jgi:xanthine dehydrogenase YagS FAD-binding subunit
MLPKFAYVQPSSVKQAVKELTSENAKVHAGGSDLIGCLRDRVFNADKVVSLSGISGLTGIRITASGTSIGAMTNIVDIAEDDEIKARYPALFAAANVIASPQLRNQGTLAGNICQRPRCWYFRGDFDCARKGGDLCYAADGENIYHAIFGGGTCYIVHPSDSAPALIAHRAKVRVTGPSGERTVPMDEFFVLPEDDLFRENVLKPNEIITEVLLPPVEEGIRGCYRKIRTRESWDFAIVSAAVVLKMEGGVVGQARIVLGGVAPKPWRVPPAEKELIGKALDTATIEKVADAALAGTEPLEQNGYKVQMAKGAVIEALMKLAE